MSAKHTPGPCGCTTITIECGYPVHPRIVYCAPHAAAPELLAALKSLLNGASTNWDHHDPQACFEMARAAIAKAEGSRP